MNLVRNTEPIDVNTLTRLLCVLADLQMQIGLYSEAKNNLEEAYIINK